MPILSHILDVLNERFDNMSWFKCLSCARVGKEWEFKDNHETMDVLSCPMCGSLSTTDCDPPEVITDLKTNDKERPVSGILKPKDTKRPVSGMMKSMQIKRPVRGETKTNKEERVDEKLESNESKRQSRGPSKTKKVKRPPQIQETLF